MIPPKEYLPRFVAGCESPPVTVTKGGGVSAPDWRGELNTPKKGAERKGKRGWLSLCERLLLEREREAEGERELVLRVETES